MTIECYYKWCSFHSSQIDPDNGPYCFEECCRASTEELKEYAEKRAKELIEYENRFNWCSQYCKDRYWNPCFKWAWDIANRKYNEYIQQIKCGNYED